MSVRRDGVKARETHPVLTKELAPGEVRISINACLRSLWTRVKDLSLVDVLWNPLISVDWHVEETSCFPVSSNEGRAHH
jgi:hypothetical protein